VKTRQAGFSTIEAIIIGVILIALIAIGVWVVKEQSKEDKPSYSSAESVDAPAVPQVDAQSDLEEVDKTLDSLNLEAGVSDNADLDTQSDAFSN